MSALVAEIQALRGRYPEPKSAVMPALQLAQQHRGGWLSEQSLRDVAAALGVTPAYCLSIASFYDMFRLEPAGATVIEVCTNVSCGLEGAQEVVEALERELGLAAGEANDAFSLRTVECLGGCGWATVVAVDNRHRLHVHAADVPQLVAELRGEEWIEREGASPDVGA